jgi:D-alanyl-D-alanine carboxypeptidase (penicillin-binding protein 5/6)
VITGAEAGSIFMKGEKENLSYQKEMLTYVNAPLSKGQKIGEIKVYKGAEFIKSVDIVSAENVAKGGLIKEIMKMFAETFLI